MSIRRHIQTYGRRHRQAWNTAAWAILLLAGVGAHAGDEAAGPFLSLSVGEIGIVDDLDDPARYGFEYRFRERGRWKLAPGFGVSGAENGARFYYVDLRRDFEAGNRWLVTPSFGLGSFDDSDVLDLGNELEFRSGIEIACRFRHGLRLGLALFHLSNGHLGRRNPGTEELAVSLHIPVGRRTGARMAHGMGASANRGGRGRAHIARGRRGRLHH
jgi:hypothetical protein